MAKVLVTGANGFAGSWLCRHLLKEEHEVFALVRPKSDLTELQDMKVNYLSGDVTDAESVQQACQGMNAVFHLAGVIAYRKADRDKMEAVNVGGTANVLEACRKTAVQRLVHMSSVTAIGAGFTQSQVLNEDSEYNLSHLNLGYFETKRKAEVLVKNAVKKSEVDAVIVNPSTMYGPGDAKKGSRKTQIKVAQGRFKFYTSGGVNIVAIQDAVDGILSAWKKGRSGERYILAGENLLIKDAFALIAESAGKAPPPYLMPKFLLHAIGIFADISTELGHPMSLSQENAYTSTLYHWFDSTKAQRELDFRPRPARYAIAESVQWMRANGLLKY